MTFKCKLVSSLLKEEKDWCANLFCTLDFSSWHSPNWKPNWFRGENKMSLSNQNMPTLTLKHSAYDTVSIRFPCCSSTGGWQKYSLQCYCTSLTHQLFSGANVRSNQSTYIFTQQFEVKKCELTDQGNINYFSCLDLQWKMEMGWQIRSCQSH